MKINLQKVLFHTLTNQNGEVSYYGEVYLKKSSNWVSSEPVAFAWNLIKLRFHYGILKSKKPLKLKGTKDQNIHLNYHRLKLSQSLKGLLDYKHVITDVLGSLLQSTFSEETLFRQLEKEFGIKGFAAMRKKYQNTCVPIKRIYQKLEKKLQVTLSPEREMELAAHAMILNPFVLETLDAAAANYIKVTGIIDSCYPREFFEEAFRKWKIHCITDLVITSEKQKRASQLVTEYVRKYKKQEKGYEKRVRIFASDYKQYILKQRRKWNTATYYPVPEQFLSRNALPHFEKAYGTFYQRVEGILNYSRPLTRSEEYQTASLYLAPAAYEFLRRISEMAGGKKVAFLGSSRHFLVELFQKYFGEASTIEWSYLAGNQPKEPDDWKDIFMKMPFLQKISADRIAAGFDFTAPDYKLERVQGDFISGWKESAAKRSDWQEGTESYLNSLFPKDQPVLVVDLTENSMGSESFYRKLKEYGVTGEYTSFSFCRMLQEEKIPPEPAKRVEALFHSILQIELPVLLRIGLDQISFAQPYMLPTGEKEKLYCGMDEYFRVVQTMMADQNRIPNISVREIEALLLAGEPSIQQLQRRLIE